MNKYISYIGAFSAVTLFLHTTLTSKLLLSNTLLCYGDNLLLLASKYYYYLEHQPPLALWAEALN